MESLYFIAVVPPTDIRDKVTEIKEEFADRFESRHALRSPPHITLHMPFRWKDKRRQELDDMLKTVGEQSFELTLRDFGCFKPRVIFINVLPSQSLSSLYNSVGTAMKSLHIFNSDYKDKPFHPHMTVAFRDLKKARFLEAWHLFEREKIDFKFRVDRFYLLKNDSQGWKTDTNFTLSQSENK